MEHAVLEEAAIHTPKSRQPRGPYKHGQPDEDYLRQLGMMTLERAAQIAGCGVQTFLTRSMLPTRRLGRHRVVKIADVNAFLLGEKPAQERSRKSDR